MTIVLYHHYHPDIFTGVIGRDHVTRPLRVALRTSKVTHAYLFSGSWGCGKTTPARILACCLDYVKGPAGTSCGSCDSCRELTTGGTGLFGVVGIGAAPYGGIDDARELRERAIFAPVRNRYKVFIIDKAYMVTNQGFNTLPKLVEELPEYMKLVFTTIEPERVIGTIRSRIHHYPFRLVPPDILGSYLYKLVQEKHMHIAQGVLPMVIRSGGDPVRDTLSVLDQFIAGSINNEFSYETAIILLSYTDTVLLNSSIDVLISGNGADAYRVIGKMVESGHGPYRFVESLLQRSYNLLIVAIVSEGAGDVLSDVPADQSERMCRRGANWGARGPSRAADLAGEVLRQMVGTTSPKLQLELLIGRILLPSAPPSAQPFKDVTDLVSSTDGSQENGPQGHFGAREAREAPEYSRHSHANERAGMSERNTTDERSSAGEPHATREREGSAQYVSPTALGRSSPENRRAAPANSSAAATHWPETAVPSTSVTADTPGTPGASKDPGAHRIIGASTVVDAPNGPSWPPVNDSPSDNASSDWLEVVALASNAQARTHNPNETVTRPSRARSAQEPEHPAAAPQAQDSDTSTLTGSDQEDTPTPPNAPLEVPPGIALPHNDQEVDTIRECWNEALPRLGFASRFMGTLVSENAQLDLVHGSELVLFSQHVGLILQFSRGDHVTALSDAIFEVTGIYVTVGAQTWQVGTEPAIVLFSMYVSTVPSSPASDYAPQRDALE